MQYKQDYEKKINNKLQAQLSKSFLIAEQKRQAESSVGPKLQRTNDNMILREKVNRKVEMLKHNIENSTQIYRRKSIGIGQITYEEMQ